jgi:hypothetical protein
MVDGFGNMLCAPKGERRSPMVDKFGSMVEFSPNFEINGLDLKGCYNNKIDRFLKGKLSF